MLNTMSAIAITSPRPVSTPMKMISASGRMSFVSLWVLGGISEPGEEDNYYILIATQIKVQSMNDSYTSHEYSHHTWGIKFHTSLIPNYKVYMHGEILPLISSSLDSLVTRKF